MPNKRSRAAIVLFVVAAATAFGAALSLRPGKNVPLLPRGEGIARENLSRAGELIERFCAIPIDDQDSASVLFHGLLACGSELKVFHDGISDPLQVAITRLADRPTATINQNNQKHPAQFLAYMVTGARGLHCQVWDAEAINRAFIHEQDTCHGLSDVAWMIPALCFARRPASFVNRFGEEMHADSLVRILLKQAGQPRAARPCYGFHDMYALAIASSFWHDQLSESALRDLQRALHGRCSEVRRHFGARHFDARAYTAELDLPNPPGDEGYYHFHGHLIEALVACGPGAAILSDDLAAQVTSRCVNEPLWRDIPALKSRGSPPGALYNVLAHLVHGLRMYRDFAEQTPHNAAVRQAQEGRKIVQHSEFNIDSKGNRLAEDVVIERGAVLNTPR